jgi:hypothetical protein
VANEIGIAVCATQLEVSVVGRQPRVDNIRDGNATVSKNQRAWRLLAAVACVALDANPEELFFVHLMTCRLEPIANPVGPTVLPMCSE